ncbi:MAG: hypothetical protein JXR88_00140 [Clostridia bacterium]|nr:hypothetical protein [Clostridia bacterium]
MTIKPVKSISIKNYIETHETFMRNQLKLEENFEDLQAYHLRQIKFIQHERLIHLLVLMLTSMIWFMNVLFLLKEPILGLVIIFFILGMLVGFYLMHYLKLENTVQRWYCIYNTLEEKRTGLSCNLNQI